MPQADTPNGRRRRFVFAIATACVVAVSLALAAGIAFARFSAGKPAQTNTVAAGTVTFSNTVTSTCGATRMLPGASPPACTLSATYGGAASGWMALDVLIETQSGNGGTALYHPSDAAHDLQVTVSSSSPAVTYTAPTVATSCPTGAPLGSTCYELDNELVSTTAFTRPSTTVTFSVTVHLPSGTTTGYRGGAAQVILTAHATQSANNPATGCAAGQTCSAVHWS